MGISLCIEPTAAPAGFLSHEAAMIRIDKTGTVTVAAGTGSQGQSVETTMSQIVAETWVWTSTTSCTCTTTRPFRHRAAGRAPAESVYSAAVPATLAATELRAKVLEIAAHLLEAAPEDLDIDAGVISVRGTPTLSVRLADVATVAYVQPARLPPGMEPGLEVAPATA